MSCYTTIQNTSPSLFKDKSFCETIQKAAGIIDTMIENEELEFSCAAAMQNEVSICLECDFDLTFYDCKAHPFFSLIQLAESFSFSKAGEDRLRATFIFCANP